MASSLDRDILRLCLPAVVSNITVPLLGLVDTAIAGHLGSETYIGAINVGAMMMNMVFWLFAFLRMGTTGLTAQAYGAGDYRRCYVVLYQALLIAVTIGVVMVVASYGLTGWLVDVMGASDDVSPLATRYFSICIWYAPACMATTSLLGWFLGMQDTVRPMIISISVNVVNIVLSLLLVVVCGMGFVGVAYGSLIANWFGLALAVVLFMRFTRGRRVSCHLSELIAGPGLRRFFSVNTDIFFRSACIMIVSVGMTSIAARISDMALAANAVMMQFFIFFSYFMDGLAFTGEALVGRYSGAGDRMMLRRAVGRIVMWSGVVAAVFFAVYLCGARPIVTMITDQTQVIDYVMDYKLWLVLIPPVTVAAFVLDGFYIGLTATRTMLYVTLTAALIFFAVAFVHPTGMPIIAIPSLSILWFAFLAYLSARGILLGILLPRNLK